MNEEVRTKAGALRVLANTSADGGTTGCSGGNCPTVYEFGGDSVLVQGYAASEIFARGTLPDGEEVVRIPKGLLRQLVARGEI